VLRPFLDHYLKDDAAPVEITPVTAFETGTNRWQALSAWLSGCAPGCGIDHQHLFLQAGGQLRLGSSLAAAPDFESYVSDPAKPVPYLPRPIHIGGDDGETNWQTWLLSDQRNAAARTGQSELSPAGAGPRAVKISGEPVANLIASTPGTDGDFVVGN